MIKVRCFERPCPCFPQTCSTLLSVFDLDQCHQPVQTSYAREAQRTNMPPYFTPVDQTLGPLWLPLAFGVKPALLDQCNYGVHIDEGSCTDCLCL